MKTKWIWLTSITLLAALLLSGTAFAEGEEPPALPVDPAAVVAEGPVVVVEAAAAAEVPAIEEIPAVAVEEPAAVEAPAPVIVEEPQVVLADAQGEPVAMASQEAAQTLAAADPYFKVGTVYYRFSEAADYCSTHYPGDTLHCFDGSSAIPITDAIQAAINYIRDNGTMPTDGKIYVEEDTYSHSATIDGSLPYLANLKGLIGIADTGGIFPQIIGDVTISQTIKGFTLSGFTIDGAVSLFGNVGALVLQDLDVDGHSILINHSGNVTMKNVKTRNSGSTGTAINNLAAGNVAISDSEFTYNNGDGLYIKTNGTASFNNIIARGNNLRGISLSGSKSVTIKNVIANNNTNDYGIRIQFTSGSLKIENVTASGNGIDGVNVNLTDKPVAVTIKNLIADNNNINGLFLTTLGAVTITNSQTNGNINNDGLYIETSGKVTLNGIRSSDNGQSGVFITGVYLIGESYPGSGDFETIGMAGPASVTITSPKNAAQSNVFNGNGLYGISVCTDRPVSLSNFSASGNTRIGVMVNGYVYHVYNSGGDFWETAEKYPGATTITATIPNYSNEINKNIYTGLYITSSGTVKLERTNANGNAYNGIDIDTSGAITLKNVSANGNTNMGIWLVNNKTGSTKGVSLTSVRADYNNERGIQVYSNGPVVVKDTNANSNAKTYGNVTNGGTVQDYYNSSLGADKWGFNSGAGGSVTVRMELGGLDLSGDFLDVYDLSPSILLYNSFDTLLSVTQTCLTDTFNYCEFTFATGTDEDYYMLVSTTEYIDTFYRLAVNDPDPFIGDADLYWANGLAINTIGNTTLSGTNTFKSNSLSGVEVMTGAGRGNISAANVSASGNGIYGINLNNNSGTGSITLSGNNQTLDNGWEGLNVSTTGTVKVANLEASYNGLVLEYDGVNINANGTGKAVTLGHVTMLGNGYRGMSLFAMGNVTLSNIRANENLNSGITVQNFLEPVSGFYEGTGSVTISGFNEANLNGGTGLEVNSNGKVTISNLAASNNDSAGVFVSAYGINKAVTLNFISAMENNDAGIIVQAHGTTTLNNVKAWLNHDGGRVDSDGNPLIVKFSSFMANNNWGLAYGEYLAPAYPLFKFISINNVFMGNTVGDLVPMA